MTSKTIEEGYQKALEVLKNNATSYGFSASSDNKENYFSLWARDHSITTLGVVLTENSKLIDCAKKGILTLFNAQNDNGQVPSYIEIKSGKRVYGGLGSITSVDSNMWVLIAAISLYKYTKDKRFISKKMIEKYKKLYSLFDVMDINNDGFVEVPIAGDWADILSRVHHVLYDQVLYYEALNALDFFFREVKKTHSKDKETEYYLKKISEKKTNVKRRINEFLWLKKDNLDKIKEHYMIINDIPKKNYNYYQSYLMPFRNYWYDRFDTLGNILSIITGIADEEKRDKIVSHVFKNKINEPFPIKSLSPVINPDDRDWEEIYKEKEKPYHYHNGGVWPFIGGLWIHVLAKMSHHKAVEECEKLASNLKKQNWSFNEYMHGKTGKEKGKNGMSWSASGYIIAYHAFHPTCNCFYWG